MNLSVQIGPYREMGHGYTVATQWMAEHGITPSGIVYEFYLNNPAQVPESELVTQVAFKI
ncbi:GyrI-like domain-containing protein [Sphaerochaeta halotolerans]|uniref:GyrI-like domain-containing protein n=1 Tax=Sphaerochaeta halotolerans TaxID=2293840 RepID=UPI001058C0B9|nr:GyrI-like domain-containing protein [Sphaerochaeta halotolerans]